MPIHAWKVHSVDVGVLRTAAGTIKALRVLLNMDQNIVIYARPEAQTPICLYNAAASHLTKGSYQEERGFSSNVRCSKRVFALCYICVFFSRAQRNAHSLEYADVLLRLSQTANDVQAEIANESAGHEDMSWWKWWKWLCSCSAFAAEWGFIWNGPVGFGH